MFLEDAEVGAWLPAPGFPQSLPGGRAWQDLLAACARDGEARGAILITPSGEPREARGYAVGPHAVLVLAGGEARPDALHALRRLLPLVIAALRGEQALATTAGQAAVARLSATEQAALTSTLDRARRDLEGALREAEAARLTAERADRAKDVFLATLSHELRTPLNAIMGWAHVLRTESLEPAMVTRALETIDRNAKLQEQLIADMLDLSRITAGKLRLNVRSTEPGAVVEAALQTVQPAARAREISIDAILDPAAGPIAADPDRLQQVFWNILSNAIKFTPKGGRVEVRLQRLDSHVEVTVADNGRGIDTAFLPFVFDRFRQQDSSDTRAQGGAGLGLSIVRHLVELHGGTVRAANRMDTHGAIFTVRLARQAVAAPGPADGGARHPTAGSEVDPAAPSLTGIRVLVVDDEPDSREMIAVVLEGQGAEAMVVASASEALEALQHTRPDILISDIGMPDVSGHALLRDVRALPPERGGLTPAVALTAYAASSDRVESLVAGFQMHLAKPVSPPELIAAVASLVNTSPKR